MQNSDLIRVNCIHCDKRVGLRPDQLGRRVRCPSCKRTFQVDRPTEPGGPIYVRPEATPESESPGAWEPVDDANEMVRVARPQAPPPPSPPSPTSKAKLSATFQRRQALVYQTAVRAVRECGCEIVELDRSNHHLRFSLQLPAGQVTEHYLYVFDEAGGACEMDIISREPDEDGQAELCYQAIIREMGKYLLYASDGATWPPPPPQPLSLPASDDYVPPRRRRQKHSGLGMSSFLIAVVVGGLDVILGLIAVLNVAGSKERSEIEGSMLAGGMSIVCLNCLSIPLCLAGVGLAIMALINDRDRKHPMTYIGLVVNALVILGVLGLYLLASVSKG